MICPRPQLTNVWKSWDLNPRMLDSKAKHQLWDYQPSTSLFISESLSTLGTQGYRLAISPPHQNRVSLEPCWGEGCGWKRYGAFHPCGQCLRSCLSTKYLPDRGWLYFFHPAAVWRVPRREMLLDSFKSLSRDSTNY